MKTFFCSLILFLSFSFALNAQTAADEKAVGDLFKELIKLNEGGKVDAMAAHFADKATAIFYNGTTIQGKQAIHEAMKQYLAYQNPDDVVVLDEYSVRFLDANNALVLATLHGTMHMEGQKMDWKGISTALFTKKSGNWLVELMQDTPIMEMPGQ
ncbi:MAG: nuclear transport factor 2 family protein [Saprospiraceae bacterium]